MTKNVNKSNKKTKAYIFSLIKKKEIFRICKTYTAMRNRRESFETGKYAVSGNNVKLWKRSIITTMLTTSTSTRLLRCKSRKRLYYKRELSTSLKNLKKHRAKLRS